MCRGTDAESGGKLATSVLTVDDIAKQGDTLATFLWLAVLFALSGQLNEVGFLPPPPPVIRNSIACHRGMHRRC
jgi:hypothetical protein